MNVQRRGSKRSSERTYADKKGETESPETRMAVIENEIGHINDKIDNDLATKLDIANLKLWIYGSVAAGIIGIIYLFILLYRSIFTT